MEGSNEESKGVILMNKTYILAMIESLEKKIEILREIRKLDEEQLTIIKSSPFSTEAFEHTVDEKDVLIFKLNKLDKGFQVVYDSLKAEIEANKKEYSTEINQMKALISTITELSTTVQAEEARNKAALENYFKGEHEKIKSSRSSVKAIKTYSQTMLQGRTGYSGFMDDKK